VRDNRSEMVCVRQCEVGESDDVCCQDMTVGEGTSLRWPPAFYDDKCRGRKGKEGTGCQPNQKVTKLHKWNVVALSRATVVLMLLQSHTK